MMSKEKRRVPKLRFPGFTEDWEQRKFKDIAFKRGKISEADLPYVEFEDINSGIGTLNKNISQKVGHKKGLLFEAGDVLFGKLRPYLQNWLLCQFAGIAVGDFWVLQPQNVSSAFLYYLIQSEAYQSVANISSGTKMPRSSWPLVSETLFSIPKYKEANMIGEFFLLIDRTITLHQRKLNNLKLKKKALLQKLFPKNEERYPELRFPGFTDAWEQRKLGSLATVEMNKRIFKEQTTIKGDIPFYKIGTFGSDADSFISRELFKEYKNKYPYPNIGDILISASGSIGRTVVYNGEDAYYQDSNIVWLNHNGKIDNSFLLQFYNQVKWAGLEGSTIKRLYNKNILETNIALPKIEEQRLIGKFFELVDRSITLHQRKLDHLQLQKKALLQQMFV
ncbi:MAG: restriction endonuclease subunit S [Veillonella parvula]|uniref:restriction endonuclease subunit S n=1 Tax=Veillonella parvula TaxID=29466 RepID=UPI003992BF26